MKKLDIRYEDKDLIVVNKPCKLLTIKGEREEKNLYEEVSAYVKKQNPHNKIFVVHRLDKETSGLVIFAKSEQIKRALQSNWNFVTREYIAVVEDIMPKKKDKLVNYLRETKTFQVYVAHTGDKAITNYEVMHHNKKYSLLKINIETGRKNQIRVQLSNIGNTIVGDKKYGAKTNPLNRLGLMASKLVFIHPKKGVEIKLELDMPESYLNLVK